MHIIFRTFILLSLSFIMVIFISLFGNVDLITYLKLGFVFIACFLLGASIIKKQLFISAFSPVAFILLSTFIGLSCFSILVFIDYQIGAVIFFISIFICIVYIVKDRNPLWQTTLSYLEISALCVAFLCSLLFCFGDSYFFSTSLTIPLFNDVCKDPYFFINIVNTLSKSSIHSATYEIGTPVNYQLLGYVPAALLAKYVNIPPHLALYCFEFGLIRLLPFILIIEYIKLFHFRSAYSKWYIVLAPLFFTLFQPLHPLYLLKFDVPNMIWSGLGYVGPSSNMGYSYSFPIVLVCLILIKSFDGTKTIVTFFLFVLLFSALAAIKIPIFFAFGVFVFCIAITNIYFKHDYYLLKCVLTAVPIVLILVYVIYLSDEPGSILTFNYSYFPKYFKSLLGLNDNFTNLKIAAGVFLLLLVWGGIRFFFIMYNSVSRTHTDFTSRAFYLSAFITLLSGTAIATVFDLKIIDDSGQVIRNSSHDSLQFIRSGFFIITIVSVLACIYFIDRYKNKYRYIFYAFMALWMCVSLAALVSNLTITPAVKSTWMEEVSMELKTHSKKGLLAINPEIYTDKQYSIWLTASSTDFFWTSNSGSYTSSKNYYRHLLYQKMLIENDGNSLTQMKSEGVSTFVATPSDSSSFNRLVKLGLLTPLKDTKWLFTFTDNPTKKTIDKGF